MVCFREIRLNGEIGLSVIISVNFVCLFVASSGSLASASCLSLMTYRYIVGNFFIKRLKFCKTVYTDFGFN